TSSTCWRGRGPESEPPFAERRVRRCRMPTVEISQRRSTARRSSPVEPRRTPARIFSRTVSGDIEEVGAEMGLIEPSVLCTEVGQGAVPSAVEGADGVDDPSPGQDLLHTDTAVSVEHPLQCALPDPRALRQEPQTDDLGV